MPGAIFEHPQQHFLIGNQQLVEAGSHPESCDRGARVLAYAARVLFILPQAKPICNERAMQTYFWTFSVAA
jgi:hypothetical protein